MEFEKIKEIVTTAVAVVVAISGIIFWVQHVADEKVQSVKNEIAEIKQDVQEIEKNNREILRIVGRLEGSLQNNGRRRAPR